MNHSREIKFWLTLCLAQLLFIAGICYAILKGRSDITFGDWLGATSITLIGVIQYFMDLQKEK